MVGEFTHLGVNIELTLFLFIGYPETRDKVTSFLDQQDEMVSAPLAKRYKKVTENDTKDKQEQFKNPNSAANKKKAVKNFKLFLEFNGKETDFFNFTEPELEWLAKFYLGTRTEKGDYYSSGSLHTLRYGLNCALQEFGHNFDITDKKSVSFQSSNTAFEIALKELKNIGKGHRKATPEISPVHKEHFLLLNSYS